VDIASFVLACAPWVHPTTTQALIATESATNRYAIGVVGAVLDRQPRTLREAMATARTLRRAGWDFSAGLAQINVRNWTHVGLSLETVFEPCANLHAMQRILRECYARAAAWGANDQARLRLALSCYHAGNFVGGFRDGYVDRVVAAAPR